MDAAAAMVLMYSCPQTCARHAHTHSKNPLFACTGYVISNASLAEMVLGLAPNTPEGAFNGEDDWLGEGVL